MKVEAMARSEDVGRINTPSSFSRNNTLFLQHPVGLPLAWIQSNSMHEGRVRLSEQVVHSIISILNVETTRGKFLSLSNPVLHKQMVHRNPDLARFLPEAMDEEIFVTVNRTKVVVANTSATVVVPEDRLAHCDVSIPVYAPDPLANWTCSNFSVLPCEKIKEIIQSDNVTSALLNLTSSLIHRSTASLVSTPTSFTPTVSSTVSSTVASTSTVSSTSVSTSASHPPPPPPSPATIPNPPAPKTRPSFSSSSVMPPSPSYGGDSFPPPPVYHY